MTLRPTPRAVESFWDALWHGILLFLCMNVRIVLNRMPMPSNEALRNLLPNEPIESFWDALWLELWPFLYFD